MKFIPVQWLDFKRCWPRKATFVSVTRIVKKKCFKCLHVMVSFRFTYLLGYDFNMCSQHSGRCFSVPLPYNRNANVAL